MDLWIRSQDRESLTKVSDVEYTYKKGDLYTDVRGKHYIGTYYDNLKILGEYKSKERALEVLDEIQAILSPKLKTTLTKDGLNVEVIDKNYDVYQMPEKEEKKEEQEG